MHGLTPEQETALALEMRDRVCKRLRVGDGTRRLQLTTCDLAAYLALQRYENGSTGRCDPGLRALAARAGISRGAAATSTHRLRIGGWISWVQRLRYVHGSLRFCRVYRLHPVAPGVRPIFPPKAGSKEKRGLGGAPAVDKPPQAEPPLRSVARQLALLEAWAGPGPSRAARPPLTWAQIRGQKL